MAFPTLFPQGRGDPFALFSNSSSKTFLEKVRHLLMYGEEIQNRIEHRFAQHPRFVLWCFNIYFRHLTLSQGDVYLGQNPQDANLSIEQLREHIKTKSSENSVLKNLKRYMVNIPGSPSYWNNVGSQLSAIIESKGPPHFFSHSHSQIGKKMNFNEIILVIDLLTNDIFC